MANNPVTLDEKVPRRVWKITLITFSVLGLVIAGSWLWSNWPKSEKSSVKISKKSAPAQASSRKVTRGLNPTGITLQPGEELFATKDPSSPPVALVIRFPNGNTRNLAASFWEEKSLTFFHTGPLAKKPVAVFYEGEKGKYHFKKIPAPAKIPPPTSPAVYYHPLKKPSRQSQTETVKNDCPFD